MGQQSSSQGAEVAPARTSYYELLGIQKTASDDEVKKAYRRKALELHPDRNYGNVEEATRLFTEVQAAYEVLSDPQERAWYDSHEEAVLSGFDDGERTFDGSIPVTTSEDIAKLSANFSGKNDFTDSPTGFFSSLRDVFDRLAKEETLAAQSEGIGAPDYPSFGSAEDDYDDVAKPFYDTWAGFATKKSFAWKDIYRLSEAPNRSVRRAMEKENKRLRDEAIREFNDTICTLIAYVKKRDPRVKSAQVLSDSQRQQALREQTAAQAARARAANIAKLDAHVEAEWMKSGQGVEASEEEHVWSEDEAEPIEQFECIVCDKVFKTEKQYEAHEKSKKHVQAVKRIQRQMRKEGVELGLDCSSMQAGNRENAPNVVESRSSMVQADTDSGQAQDLIDAITTSISSVPAADELSSDEQCDNSTRSEASNDDYASRDEVSERLADMAGIALSGEEENDGPMPQDKKVGKAKEKRARRAAKQAVEPMDPDKLSCARCQAHFQSKTQLFNHLKKNPSHAQPIQRDKSGGRASKKR